MGVGGGRRFGLIIATLLLVGNTFPTFLRGKAEPETRSRVN